MHNRLLIFFGVLSAAAAFPRYRRGWDPFHSGYSSFGGPGAFAGGYAGGGAGAFAGTGFMPIPIPVPYVNDNPYYSPFGYSSMYPFSMPSFTMPNLTPWYLGPNVCVEKRVAEEPQEFKDVLGDSPSDSSSSYEYSGRHEHCSGTDSVYVCRGSKSTPEGNKMYLTKYQCCHGFVRARNGEPGCVESESSEEQPTVTASSTEKMDASTKYNFVPKGSEKAPVAGVPPQ